MLTGWCIQGHWATLWSDLGSSPVVLGCWWFLAAPAVPGQVALGCCSVRGVSVSGLVCGHQGQHLLSDAGLVELMNASSYTCVIVDAAGCTGPDGVLPEYMGPEALLLLLPGAGWGSAARTRMLLLQLPGVGFGSGAQLLLPGTGASVVWLLHMSQHCHIRDRWSNNARHTRGLGMLDPSHSPQPLPKEDPTDFPKWQGLSAPFGV